MQRALAKAVQRSRHDQHCLAIAPFFVVRSAHTEPKRVRLLHPALSDAQRATIYALSTPPGKAGVAVVRVSGPNAIDVWSKLVKTRKRQLPEPWKMERCQVVHPETGEILDDGLAVFFKAPRSFTTEDVVELHIHSGRAIISSVLAALSRLPYCRPAEAGEFTRRAFHGGRLDLTQVEGLKDLVDAETEGQRRLALRAAGVGEIYACRRVDYESHKNIKGATRVQFEQLRTEIIGCLAKLEALIDFGEGEDIEEGVYEEARDRAFKLKSTIQSYLQDSRRGEILRSGVRLTIFGAPNAGKSSLLNFFAQREAAIVTPVPGTTRDILELSLDIGGIPVIVSDTAGLRKTVDPVELIGVERARKAIDAADIALCVVSCEDLDRGDGEDCPVEFPEAVRALIGDDTFILFNKSDLLTTKRDKSNLAGPHRWTTSLKTGDGTTEFLASFAKALQKKWELLQTSFTLSIDIPRNLRYALSDNGDSGSTPFITHARHRVHLKSAVQFIDGFLATSPDDIVLGAEELRYAARAVGKVSGLIDVEDVLDALFKDFCIGK
ncbi:tRNA modification GTPase TrmE [Mycena sanguinolenta]|uniref:tRNA modification GTPase TrmE n=1 Tax=Mycena sanguinolenta TaxID=230812 RepID=A0A8H6Y995_9AGAR|nr:tRNA modification GTPase TrmE [Mycena sanguinolenta]